jgi:hypothetical protein
MTKRHFIAFFIGVVVAWMARNEAVRTILHSTTKPSLLFRSASYTEPRAMILEGELPVCSAVVAGDALYTARHCVSRAKEGDEVEVLLQKDSTPVRLKVYLHKVYSDIAILSFSKTAKINAPTDAQVKAGKQVVAVIGVLLSNDPAVYGASLPYFEREAKVLAVFTAKEIGMTDIAPHIPPTAKFAVIDIGTFSGNSGSGVYIVDEQGKRHLIGVVSAGISDYTVVALF